MKNFSAKTANFQNLKVKDANVISEINLGTAPNQIPLNKDLGSLAYQDAVNLDDVSADMLELRAIAAEISDSAVDVFVYDTSRDSDGGAWRKRTQHTSWYNEELNTATRGSRREFPAVAVIVAEADKVTIYDGDDPDLSMWMVFKTWGFGGIPRTCCVALNGKVVVGSSGWGVPQADFIKDTIDHQWNAGVRVPMGGGIINRNIDSRLSSDDSQIIVNSNVNDVAMTILPNAPIDEDTGLPVPTIAVATDGGVSVIKDDGTVVDLNVYDRPYSSVYFSGNVVWAVENPETDYDLLRYFEIPTSDITAASSYGPNSSPALFPENTKGNIFDSFNYGSPIGITKLDHEGSMVAYTTSKYNTGWMPGDIKLATLSDTTVETIGESSDELVTNGDFSTDVTGWSFTSGASISHDTTEYTGGALQINQNSSSGQGAYQSINTIIGQSYVLNVIGKGDSIGNLSNLVVEIGTSIMGSELGGSIVGSGAVEGNVSITFVASSTITYISLGPTGSDTRVAYVNNISVRATTELITNGDFSNGTTGWDPISDPVLTTVNEGVNLKVLSGDNQAGFYRNISANDVNQQYILSFQASDFIGDTAANLMVSINDYKEESPSEITGNLEYISTKQDGSYSVSFNGRSGGVMIFFRIYNLTGTCSEDTSMNIKNISVRLAEYDRSVNNNGLRIVGEINKTPVAPGADLVAYSGFSANNYLEQPYNEDLDGLNSFSIMGWVKRNDTLISEQPFVSFKDTLDDGAYSNGDTFMLFGTTPNHQLFFQTHEQSTSTDAAQTVWSLETLAEGVWTNFCLVYDESTTTTKIFINGRMVNSATKNTGPVYLSNSVMTIGSRFKPTIADHVCDQVDLSIIRVSETIPTDAQIAKIYRDEKVLFQDGAQATLYGTSDAVTALAYDDKTELLHVGTSSGRSDFSGLRRINNTTTAVTTSISASNNLIAEQ